MITTRKLKELMLVTFSKELKKILDSQIQKLLLKHFLKCKIVFDVPFTAAICRKFTTTVYCFREIYKLLFLKFMGRRSIVVLLIGRLLSRITRRQTGNFAPKSNCKLTHCFFQIHPTIHVTKYF